MDHAGQLLATANDIYVRELYPRVGPTGDPNAASRPPVYKVIGIVLAITSGAFIGTSFVLKKVGLLKANEKYNEVAGEGYGYLKNFYWWAGMVLMIIGEICNFVAYAFTDAILVTPLGALSVVLTTILSAIFLKERLSMIGKVSCFLCIVGSVIIVMNAPESSSVANIQQMQSFVIHPAFLTYSGVIIVGSVITAFYVGPRWGKKNMLVYISICSWIGGLSVVATQGLGAAIVAQAGGTPQFNQWFLYVLFVFVIATLVTEIIFLNKALNLFNAAMVTPTYYVYFTSTTIITSAVLFRGFKGTPTSIVTVVLGFLTICSGVVLLQLSKSAKDVPDAAVFKGDLDQIQTIAEQEQPESEPKADAIRGTAAIVRRFSTARQKMEVQELKRLHEEKMQDQLQPVSEEGQTFEWDGLRRRRTVTFSSTGPGRSGSVSSPGPFTEQQIERPAHPPLGMSHFPTEEELAEADRVGTPRILSSIAGTIRNRARSVISSNPPELPQSQKVQSPMHPVPLTEIAVPSQKPDEDGAYYGKSREHIYGLPAGLQRTEYEGAGGLQVPDPQRNASSGSGASGQTGLAPTPPPHGARRQFSFQNVFRRNQQDGTRQSSSGSHEQQRLGLGSRGYSSPQVKGATEEERLGLVKGDSHSMPALPRYDDEEEADSDPYTDEDKRRPPPSASGSSAVVNEARYGRGITTPPRRGSDDDKEMDLASYEASRRRWDESRSGSRGTPPPPPESERRHSPPRGGDGAFI